MKTIYTVGHPDRDSSFISFDRDHEAIEWWRENIEHARETDIRHGSVVKKHTFETDAEAETARLNFILIGEGLRRFEETYGKMASCVSVTEEQWRAMCREKIDTMRNAPKPTVVQIWPKL